MAISESGIYEISGSWLRRQYDQLPSTIPSSSLHVWGVSGGPLRHDSHWAETERLRQIPLFIEDGGDGMFDEEDRILFYAEGADVWRYEEGELLYLKNPFTSSNQYILSISSEASVEVESLVTSELLNDVVDNYIYASIYHEDQINLLGSDVGTTGSGQLWVNEEVTNFGLTSLRDRFSQNLPTLRQAKMSVRLAGRSKQSEKASIRVGRNETEVLWSPVNTGDVEELYARLVSVDISNDLLSTDDAIELQYDKRDQEARLWMDYIQISGTRKIEYDGLPTLINNLNATAENAAGIQLPLGDFTVWNITDVHNSYQIIPNSQHKISTSNSYQSFILFDTSDDFPFPTPLPNQTIELAEVDLTADMIIIYPEEFKSTALKLAEHRSSYSGLHVSAVSITSIYHSYTGGRKDPTAIRNFLRDHYRQGGSLKHVLLFGDASYDYRHIDQSLPDTDLIPTFETFESLDPLFAFPSDDYFVLLDDDENGNLRGDIDLGIGRLTARSTVEAENMVSKIIHYDLQKPEFASWKKRIVFVADDEDRNLHLNDADDIAVETKRNYPVFNQEKIYFDAFPQVSTPGGNRFPGATDRLNSIIDQGALIVNYLGHGGPRGWAQERVLKIDDITSWKNRDRLPLIITATCSFTGFDDPALTSAGEAVMLNPVGGAVALFTTVRSVFASKNFRLTQAVYRQLFQQEAGEYYTLGEIMMNAKNSLTNDALNGRKFFLIGDPSMRLAIPDHKVITTSINGKQIAPTEIADTIGALDRISLTGEVLTPFGELAKDYNGTLQIEVFDKPTDVQTLGNDERSFLTTFSAQTNSLYKGRVKVENGKWKADAVLPVDINYSPGVGKISYVANSTEGISAIGFNEQFIISGFSEDPITDNSSPDVALYLNDREFSSGDIVGRNNLMIADISDDVGINISSVGIGHEMIAKIDGQTQVVTEFYTPSTDNPTSGVILFTLPELSPGPHKLSLTVFDVANNPGSASVDFIIDAEKLSTIKQIDVYPNPAIKNERVTLDLQTTHIAPINEVIVDTYTSTGQLINSQSELLANDNGRILAAANLPLTGSQFVILKIRVRDIGGDDVVEPIFKKVIFLK